MGCECCKIETPRVYEKCQQKAELARKFHKRVISPCGILGSGSNYTPPKPKKKRKEKTKNRRRKK